MNNKITITLLAGNTFRARAYAQQLGQLNNEDLVIKGFFYGFDKRITSPVSIGIKTKDYLTKQNLFIPDLNENIQVTFKKNNWQFIEHFDENVNASHLISELHKIETDIIVFAGYGGQLLRSEHFNKRVKYLHMHPGILPYERGSTTLYYSILNNRKLSVTAFYMTENIDDGEIVYSQQYERPSKGVNIDIWLDNVIRANCFEKALKIILQGDKTEITGDNSNEYYVIHPVLKHIALLSLSEK
jgi:methionyl-tRNA formyltransferase